MLTSLKAEGLRQGHLHAPQEARVGHQAPRLLCQALQLLALLGAANIPHLQNRPCLSPFSSRSTDKACLQLTRWAAVSLNMIEGCLLQNLEVCPNRC